VGRIFINIKLKPGLEDDHGPDQGVVDFLAEKMLVH